MNDESVPPEAQSRDLQTGIFNMVVTLVRHMETFASPHDAREFTAVYLENIAKGLRSFEEDQTKQQENSDAEPSQ